MRIIGGELGGRILDVPLKSWPTRPTTDIAKEALYNILTNRIDYSNVRFLDLFGGSGAHTLEFLSRGCLDVTYVDQYPKCVLWVRDQVRRFQYSSQCTIIKKDVRKFIRSSSTTYDVIFADPPYALTWLDELPRLIFSNGMLVQNGTLIIEHGREHDFTREEAFTEVRKYGQSRFSFFKPDE